VLPAGVKLDFRNFPDGYVVTATRGSRIKENQHSLKPLEIVMVNTRGLALRPRRLRSAAAAWATRRPCIARARRAAHRHGRLELDAPFVHTAEKYKETGDASLIWEGIKRGGTSHCHLEKLHNLEPCRPNGFVVSCFPHKDPRASAAGHGSRDFRSDAVEELRTRLEFRHEL